MRRTPGEIAAWRQRMVKLAKMVSQLALDEQAVFVERLGGVSATVEGHPLSLTNTIFLAMQSEGQPVALVGGFQQWKQAGRSVRHGQKAKYIWAPSGKRAEEASAETTKPGEGEEQTRQRFRLVAVFSIDQ